jgi:hypothetical protein
MKELLEELACNLNCKNAAPREDYHLQPRNERKTLQEVRDRKEDNGFTASIEFHYRSEVLP